MSRGLVLILLTVVLQLPVQAKRISGLIITEQDTLKVTLDIPLKANLTDIWVTKLQKQLVYLGEEDEKIVVEPGDIKGFQFTYDYEEYTFVSIPNTLDLAKGSEKNPHLFVQRIIEGDLTLYYLHKPEFIRPNNKFEWRHFHEAIQGRTPILKKADGSLQKIESHTTREEVAQFLEDCPVVVERLNDKDFMDGQILWILDMYNANCGRSSTE